MFSWLKRKYNYLKLLNSQKEVVKDSPKPVKIPESSQEIKKKLQEIFAACSDFHLREISLGESKLIIAFMDNLASKQLLNDNVLKPLLEQDLVNRFYQLNKNNSIDILVSRIINNSQLKVTADWTESVRTILSGDSVIYVEGNSQALLAATKGWESRSVTEPQTETVVRGPREGFIENLGVNCAMIRRKIKNPGLKMELITLGQQTKTDICICYLKGIADEELVQEVKSRINKINIDAVLESGYIEEMIEDAPFSLFPTVGNSEKPDVVAGKILEGRVAILCDGTPFVLTVPYLFFETLQASEDYYTRSINSSFLRMLRIVSFYVSLLLPSLYVAFLSFHQAVLPLNFLLTIAASREGVPFSPFTEALFMGLTFEILEEAGVRMPRPIGQSISIVGALVIGEASVRAGLVSNPMVIITAITAISTFILPPLQRVLPYFRLVFIVIANILGLLGIFLGLIALVIHMCSLRSFGVPYLVPLAPLSPSDLKDTLLRLPHWAMLTRPRALTWQETGRAKFRKGLRTSKKK